MASGGPPPRPKFLIAFDLDDTLFDPKNKHALVWWGGVDFWVNLSSTISDIAAQKESDVVFMIATSKESVDDMCINAAKNLRTFLSLHCPELYKTDGKDGWVLVNFNGTLQYENLDNGEALPRTDCIKSDAFSHFYIEHVSDKNPLILDVAQKHKIPAENCILLDNNRFTLDFAARAGIRTVSFEIFNDIGPAHSVNRAWLMGQLNDRAAWLKAKVNAILDVKNILEPTPSPLDVKNILEPTPSPLYAPQFSRTTSPPPVSPIDPQDDFAFGLSDFFTCGR